MQTGETPVLLAFTGLLPLDCHRSKLNGYVEPRFAVDSSQGCVIIVSAMMRYCLIISMSG